MRLAQPDGRSCGAASLVMARRSVEASYAAKTSDQPAFAREVQRLHRQITSLVDSAGGLHLPWLRAIGTPPWAVAREMRLITGNAYDVNACMARDPWPWVSLASEANPVVVFVGNRLAPRHVVLALTVITDADDSAEAAWTYEPASGQMRLIRRPLWQEGRLGLAGWNKTWFVIAPQGPHSPA